MNSDADLLTVHNVKEWLSSLRLVPSSSDTVEIEISDDGFKVFDQYKVEYSSIDGLEQWKEVRKSFTFSMGQRYRL